MRAGIHRTRRFPFDRIAEAHRTKTSPQWRTHGRGIRIRLPVFEDVDILLIATRSMTVFFVRLQAGWAAGPPAEARGLGDRSRVEAAERKRPTLDP